MGINHEDKKSNHSCCGARYSLFACLHKEMLPIVDKPTIQFIVEEAKAAGIEDILIVTGKNKRAIENHFDSNPELEQDLEATEKDLRFYMNETFLVMQRLLDIEESKKMIKAG